VRAPHSTVKAETKVPAEAKGQTSEGDMGWACSPAARPPLPELREHGRCPAPCPLGATPHSDTGLQLVISKLESTGHHLGEVWQGTART
jgi:hypothetical protein